jgi:hypothetical protein
VEERRIMRKKKSRSRRSMIHVPRRTCRRKKSILVPALLRMTLE